MRCGGLNSDSLSAFVEEPVNPVNRRTILRYSGMAAASFSLRNGLWALSGAPDAPSANPVAKTTYGQISGMVEDGINVFLSIPYGADTAPVRFQAPLPPAPWTGVKVCDAFTTRAPQLAAARVPQAPLAAPSLGPAGAGPRVAPEAGAQSEDCLHLNVFTPGLRDHRKRPVLVYFHGGAYNNGSVNSALYDGKRLCHRGDVVVVTVNHRLNAFGFMYLGAVDPKQYPDSGNVGMLDLVLALKWVKNNIAEFGGDSSRVLIFGQSGGGAKCATLMAMPAGKRLVPSRDDDERATGEGRFNRDRFKTDRRDAGQTWNHAGESRRSEDDSVGADSGCGRCDELRLAPGGRWRRAFARSLHAGCPPALSEDVPMILGNVHDETAVPVRGTLTWDDAPAALKHAVAIYLGPYSAEEVVAKYRTIYPDRSPIDVVVAAATAFRAWPGQVMEAERRASNPKSQRHTWVYQMNWHRDAPGARAMHTIDIPFMFDNLAAAPGQIGGTADEIAKAQPLADAMAGMLINYGATGNPNHPGLPSWPTYDLDERNTMIWDSPPAIMKDPRGDERRYAAGSSYRQPGTY